MNEVINLNSDILKRKIRKKIQDMEELILFNDKSGNQNDLIAYLHILFFDTIPMNELFEMNQIREIRVVESVKTGSTDIQNQPMRQIELIKDKGKSLQIMNDPEGYYEGWFDRIFTENNNNNNSKSFLKSKILQVLRGKYIEIKKKEEECTKTIKQLEELFIQDELEKKIPLTNYQKKIFKIDTRNILGNHTKSSEMFARYIFCQYFYQKNIFKSLPTEFYPDDIFQDIDKSNDNIKSFTEWNHLLQYWLIYILLINKFISKESNFDDFLKTKSLFEMAKKVGEFRKEGDSSSKKKKGKKLKIKTQQKKKHNPNPQRGGDPNFNMEFQKYREQKKHKKNGQNKSKDNKSKESNLIREYLKKSFFFKGENIYNFSEYLNGQKRKELVQTFYDKRIINKTQIGIHEPFPLLFYPSMDINFSKFKKRDSFRFDNVVSRDEFISVMKENITILQTLYNYQESNISLFEPLLKNIRESVLMYYFALFYKKKFIYKRYLQVFDRYLEKAGLQLNELVKNTKNDNSNKNQNENNNNHETQNENNHSNVNKKIVNENRVVNTSHLSPSNLQKYHILIQKIQLLKEKKEELEENKNQMNTNEKILVIEKYIRDLQLQKYQLLS